MSKPLIDFTYLHALAGDDPAYLYEVLHLFLDTVTTGVKNLEQLVNEATDYDGIKTQAHSLKSTTSIVNVRDMYEDVKQIEVLAKHGAAGKAEITAHLSNLLANFNEALPILLEEKEKNRLLSNK